MQQEPILNAGHAGANCNSPVCNLLRKLSNKVRMILQSRLVTVNCIPVEHTEYLGLVIRAQYLLNSFRKCLCIARFVTKVSRSDIEPVLCRVIDVGEIVTLRIRASAD